MLLSASPSAPSCWSSFRPGTSVDVELVCGPQQDGDRLSSTSSELAAAVSPSENSRLGMEKEAESEDSCWSSEAPAVTTDEFSFSSRSKPAGTHQRANSCTPSSQHPNMKFCWLRRSNPDPGAGLTSYLPLLLRLSCPSAGPTEILLLWWP